MLRPIDVALAELGLAESFTVLGVPSGYPAPKYVNLTVIRDAAGTTLVETGAGDAGSLASTTEALRAAGVHRLDRLLATHTHGDHAGAAAALRRFGRAEPEAAAPVYLHSAGHRMLTTPALEYLDEAFEIATGRAHRGVDRYDEGLLPDTFTRYRRLAYADRYLHLPRTELRFVDHGQVPAGFVALPTPGHSDDCVLFLHEASGVAFPGDTILSGGVPDDPASHRVSIPPLTLLQQRYGRAVEAYLQTIGRLRRLFAEGRVRLVIPPHGRLGVVDPSAWVERAEGHFVALHDILRGRIAALRGETAVSTLLADLSLPTSTDPALAGHGLGLLFAYAEEGALALDEDPRTRSLRARRVADPDPELVARRTREERGPLPLLRAG